MATEETETGTQEATDVNETAIGMAMFVFTVGGRVGDVERPGYVVGRVI